MDINPVLFPQVTNRESWTQLIGLNDADTGDAIDLSTLTFVLEVRRTINPRSGYGGYGNSYDYGSYNDYGPVISLALGNGIAVVALGVLQIDITLAQMRSLSPDVYSVGMTVSDADSTRQIMLGRLPVLFGGVS